MVRSASKFEGSIRDPHWYILTSAFRRLKRAVKRSPPICYIDPAILKTMASTNPYGEIDAKLFCEKIRGQLPEKDFAFLMSVLMKDCTWAQLGAGMGLSADAARKKYDRLISNLRERLLQSGHFERQ